MKKKLKISAVLILISLVLWWGYFMFFVPSFSQGPNDTLISKNIKLELVTKSQEPQNIGINVPKFLPFWKSIGNVDGGGNLWEFDDKGKKYILYSDNTEMPGRYIYKYSKN